MVCKNVAKQACAFPVPIRHKKPRASLRGVLEFHDGRVAHHRSIVGLESRAEDVAQGRT
jgi:hypothetical protein